MGQVRNFYATFAYLETFGNRLMATTSAQTETEYKEQAETCRGVFLKKMEDYGVAWRILRPSSVTDQIFIKANRIRSIQTKGEKLIDEGVRPELVGIVNYAAMALIQCKLGYAATADISPGAALAEYDAQVERARALMLSKNHDYDEAWRLMRVSSITDIILMKVYRTKEIESHDGATQVSEGVEANYLDMINYAIFALILSKGGDDA